MSDFTQILHAAAEGDTPSADAILPLVYEDLRRLAQARMAREAADHTLQPTALVHEAWLRMVDQEEQDWKNRAYFFSAAATAMRRILIDHARSKTLKKHGGGQVRVGIDQLDLSVPEPNELLLYIEDALQALEQVHPQWAQIVVMKYFGGMTHRETAEALNIGESSVERYWAAAKVWLYRKMSASA